MKNKQVTRDNLGILFLTSAEQYTIFKGGILEIYFFNIALLNKCISQHPEHQVFALHKYSP